VDFPILVNRTSKYVKNENQGLALWTVRTIITKEWYIFTYLGKKATYIEDL